MLVDVEAVFDNDKLPHDHQHVRDDVADEQTRVELDAVAGYVTT